MPTGSWKTVKNVLQMAWEMHVRGMRYEGDSAKVGKASNNPLGIKLHSLDEQVLADALEDGFSIRRAHEVVNRNRKELDPAAKDIGYSAVRTAVARLNPVKSGKKTTVMYYFMMLLNNIYTVCQQLRHNRKGISTPKAIGQRPGINSLCNIGCALAAFFSRVCRLLNK